MKYSIIGGVIGLIIGVLMSFFQGFDRLSSGNSTIFLLVILNAIVLIFGGFIIGNAVDQKMKNSRGNWILISIISSLVLFIISLIIFGFIGRDFDMYGSIVVFLLVIVTISLIRIKWRVASFPLLLIASLIVLFIISIPLKALGHLLDSENFVRIFDSVPFILILFSPFILVIFGIVALINGIILLVRKDDRRKMAYTNLVVGIVILVAGIIITWLFISGRFSLH